MYLLLHKQFHKCTYMKNLFITLYVTEAIMTYTLVSVIRSHYAIMTEEEGWIVWEVKVINTPSHIPRLHS